VYASVVYLAGHRRMQLLCGHAEICETSQPNNQEFGRNLSNIQ